MASNEEIQPWNLVISLFKPETGISAEQDQPLPVDAPVIVTGFWHFTQMAISLWNHNGKEIPEDKRQQEEGPLWQAIKSSS